MSVAPSYVLVRELQAILGIPGSVKRIVVDAPVPGVVTCTVTVLPSKEQTEAIARVVGEAEPDVVIDEIIGSLCGKPIVVADKPFGPVGDIVMGFMTVEEVAAEMTRNSSAEGKRHE